MKLQVILIAFAAAAPTGIDSAENSIAKSDESDKEFDLDQYLADQLGQVDRDSHGNPIAIDGLFDYDDEYLFPTGTSSLYNSPTTETQLPNLNMTEEENPYLSLVLEQPPIPYFTLDRTFVTVHQCWLEYKYGINGGPSIISLEASYGRQWIQNSADLSYYKRRKRIYDAITFLINKGAGEPDAVKYWENYRNLHAMSLSQLQTFLVGEPYRDWFAL